MATLFHNIRFTYLVSFYTLNNESFTELFCENLDKPELECNGKCTITKAVQDLDKEKNELTLNSFQTEIVYYITSLDLEEDFQVHSSYPSGFGYLNQYSFLFSAVIAHPPLRTS